VNLERTVGARLRTYVVAHDPLSARVVFAGTNAGLFQSLDGGATWRKLSAQTARSIAFDPVDPGRIFVATDQGVLRIENGGMQSRNANQELGKR
jgi:ligand-binding sensor domain-containing protein